MDTSCTLAAIDMAAHDLRNAVGLVVSGAQLLDGASADEIADIAADMAGAGHQLGWFVDHAIECARIERGRAAAVVSIRLDEVITRGVRQAQRAGRVVIVDRSTVPDDAVIRVDVGIAERIVADALMVVQERGAESAVVDVALQNGACVVRVLGGDDRDLSRLVAGTCMLAAQLAQASGINMEVAPGVVILRCAMT